MNKSGLIKRIRGYVPFNAEEESDKEMILHFLNTNPDAFDRENTLAHMTASAWIVNPRRDRVLMVYHKIYDSWSWTGGHADGEDDLLSVALREAREETGLKNVRSVSEEIFSLEVLTVDGHVKNGCYLSSHMHMNVTYLLEADDNEQVHIREDENSGVQWFYLEDALRASSEPWFVQHIYKKLNEKLKGL